MPALIIRRDGVIELQVPLEKDITTLGRLEDNDVVLQNGSISRHHARIERQGNLYRIQDLGSPNGIWVAGKRVTQWDIQPGVPFVIGVFSVMLDLSATDQPSVAPAATAASSVVPSARLFVLDGPMMQREFPLNRSEVRLGRSSTCEIPIDHDAVSKQHATITIQNSQFIISDSGSRNGVFVNGLRIESQALAHRDEIEIGPARFAFSETGEFIAPASLPETVDAGQSAAPGFSAPPPAGIARWKNLLARIPKVVLFGGGAALVIIIILFALLSGPPKAEQPSDKKIAEENQQTIQKLLNEGKQFFAVGDYAGALEKANAVLTPDLDPTNREALDLQAKAQDKLREQAAARAKAEQEAAQRAARIQALVAEAATAFKANDLDTSKSKLEEASAIDPENAAVKKALGDTWVALAKAATKKRDFKGAFEAFDAALQIDPANTEALKERASLTNYEQASKAREARANSLFAQAKRESDRADSVNAYRHLGEVLELSPRYPQAAALRSQLQALLEAKAKPLYDEGVRLFNAGQLAEGIRKLNQALEIFPDHAATQQFISQTRTKLRSEAQETYKRGYISEGIGRYKEALDAYQKVLNLLPDPNEEYHKKAADKIAQLKTKGK